MFDGPANPMISERQNKKKHSHANQSPNPPFPNQNKSKNQKRWIKNRVAPKKRHDSIEKRIGKALVYESEQMNVEGLKPMHAES
jgi:hypothetical protein